MPSPRSSTCSSPRASTRTAHQRIYRAIIRLFDKSEPIDQLTVVHELREMGELEASGGPFYVANLTLKVNSAANVEYHARIITETAIKRELIRISSEIQKDAFEDTTDVFKLLDDTEAALFEVSESNIRKNFDDMRSLMGKAIKELEEKKNQKDGLTGVPTGFTALDRVTSGWQPSDLVIIAARPGMGKCMGKGTKVLMYDGDLRKVEDVRAGELLMGDDSTPRRVLSIARGRENMYWVRQNKGDDYRVNESHILSLKRSRNEGTHHHGEVLNITVKDWLAKGPKFRSNYKGYKVPVEFAAEELPIDPYFLGVWLGDGNSDSCQITTTDSEIQDYLVSFAGESDAFLKVSTLNNNPLHTRYKLHRNEQNTDSHLHIGLRELDVLKNKHIPRAYAINSTENRLLLLAGLIDSDGHLDPVSNGYEITQKNQKLGPPD
jgi:replicative DNA helicase